MIATSKNHALNKNRPSPKPPQRKRSPNQTAMRVWSRLPSNEKEISHGSVSWQTRWTYFGMGTLAHRLVRYSACIGRKRCLEFSLGHTVLRGADKPLGHAALANN
jgi:hypothetical protein